MDTQRIFLVVGLFLTGFLFLQEYQYSKQAPVIDTATPNNQRQIVDLASIADDVPNIVAQNQQDVPELKLLSAKTNQLSEQFITVKTDLVSLNINVKGGTIDQLTLNQYPTSLKPNAPEITLFNTQPQQTFLAQSGLISDAKLPTHHHLYQAKQKNYQLNNDELVVPLYWHDDAGLEVVKRYHFVPNNYLIGLSYEITNRSQVDIAYASYLQLLRDTLEQGNAFLPTFAGGAIYNEDDVYEKINFDEFSKNNTINTSGGWLAMVQHYFLGAWIPNQNQNQRYSTKILANNANLISTVGAYQTLKAGQSVVIDAGQLYAGPKLQTNLDQVNGLDKTVDYGVLYIVAKPLEVVLHWIYRFVSSWGWSIILLTMLIKLIFYKLSETSYRSMAKMRILTPKMQHLKELYGEDKQKLSQKMMALYKQEKVNPASGCLPILVQMPVFIALYWVLLESVELRHVAFWWLSDLSTKDPYFILPVLMGVSMFVQQKLNPTPPDPMQAKIMAALPIVFTIFFFWMPSGLVLYWVVNNVLSITQQWVIIQRVGGKSH